MSAVSYEPEIIEQFASDLYAQARNTELSYTLFGLLISAGVGYYISDDLGVVTGGCALTGAVAGFLVGRSKAFLLRLQAQTALCQVEIEKNTRGTA